MIRNARRLSDFERRYQATAYEGLTFEAALALFAGLWQEARALQPDSTADWRSDLQPDLAIARAVNAAVPRR